MSDPKQYQLDGRQLIIIVTALKHLDNSLQTHVTLFQSLAARKELMEDLGIMRTLAQTFEKDLPCPFD